MKVLIKGATIISHSSPFHGQSKNILIQDGRIKAIEDSIDDNNAEVIDIPGLHVSVGWTDIFANFADPGFEYKETLESGAVTAAAGGFTNVFLIPNTSPVIHDKSQVEYIIRSGQSLPVNIFPIGAITRNCEGKELAEIYDMRSSGGVAFSDGTQSIQSAGLLVKALQYVKAFNGVVIQLPGDNSLGRNGLMNEGVISTRLGLPGKPALSEELMVSRDIELLRYTGSRLHITGISTRNSHQLILKAKSEGLGISCSASPAHILFSDEDLQEYDTNLKLNPPLRTLEDMLYLRSAVIAGEVDCFASHHLPEDYDHKICEFEYARDGMAGLQTMFAAAISSGVPVETFVKMQTDSINDIFGIDIGYIEKNAVASLTLFLPDDSYTLTETEFLSKSKNNPFIGKELKGRALGIINGTKVFLNHRELIQTINNG